MEICPSNPNRSLRSNIDWVSQLKNYYKQLSMIVAELSKKQPTSIDWKTPTTPSPGNVMHSTRTKTMSQRDDLNMGTDVALIHYLFIGLIVSRPFRIIWSLITKFQSTNNYFSFCFGNSVGVTEDVHNMAEQWKWTGLWIRHGLTKR